ncbi:hypothetical protein [Corallococcus exiguus]|uniref:Uncharacterized protein n=1 Tax=Corallococcus exiguus TaxID=83462 RepID=A0A7X4Y568_9BACT|nr:hypothetical protein [Corallococcus exiguus]NBC38830.1 hypothetical protein [Corallococcus exiguus]TNV61534.1 hypothetical protein FH620_20815 [Corallococcus exiguus]
MIHSNEKALQMARSLLPSTARRQARKERTVTNRAARREARLAVVAWLRTGDLDADEPAEVPWRKHEIELMVLDRRRADKVNPFVRWAAARVRRMPHDAREGYVRGILPKGVIGRHAWSHLEHTPAFEDTVKREARAHHWKHREQLARKRERDEVASLLREILAAPDGHATFNQYLREHATWRRSPSSKKGWIPRTPPLPHRPLRGAHDVNAFVDSLKLDGRSAYCFSSETMDAPVRWVRIFLERSKANLGDIPATLAALRAEGWMSPRPLGQPCFSEPEPRTPPARPSAH